MATALPTNILELKDEIVSLSQEKNAPEVLKRLRLLNQIQPDHRISSFIENPNQPDFFDHLTYYLRNDFIPIQPKTQSLEEIKADFDQNQQSPTSSIDYHDLDQIQKNQRKLQTELAKLNQSRAIVEGQVEQYLLSQAKFSQAEDILKSARHEIEVEVKYELTNAGGDINKATLSIVRKLKNSRSLGLRLLTNQIDETAFQQQIGNDSSVRESVEQTKKLPELIESSVVRDQAKNGQLDIKGQFRSIFKGTDVSEDKLSGIERHIVANTSLDVQKAEAAIKSQIGEQAYNNLPETTRVRAVEALVANFEAASQAQSMRDIQITLVNDGITPSTITNADAEAMWVESYQDTSEHQSFPTPSIDQIKLIGRIAENPELLNDPKILEEMVTGSNQVSGFTEKWHSFFHPERSASNASGFGQSIRTWFTNTGSKTQVWFKGFSEGARNFFEPIGKGLGKLGNGSFSSSLKGLGSGAGTFFKSTLPKLGQAFATFGKTVGPAIAKALLAVESTPVGWIVTGIIVVLAVVIPILFANPMTVARTNLMPIGNIYDYTAFENFSCSKEKLPLHIAKPAVPVAARAWQIVSDLYQGFWCYWNRSPGDASGDICSFPKCYPELFDEKLFQTDPNIAPERGPGLFWCTYLIVYSYNESGIPIGKDLGRADVMQGYFRTQGRFLSPNLATPNNVPIGSVVFFHSNSGRAGTNHVGMVATVNQDSISYIQSNGATKEGSITFNSNGTGVQDVGWGQVTGFGKP